MKKKPMNEFPLLSEEDGIPLFYPHLPKNAAKYVSEVLSSRWIGQGPKSEEFEKKFSEFLSAEGRGVAVNSGTSALHLAYILAGVSPDDEVICPVFTCTATNLPILYLGAKPVFCDVSDRNLNIDITAIESLITDRTRAIAVVDYGGVPNDYATLRDLANKYSLKLIADCAHSVDGVCSNLPVHLWADYSIFSFQAIKTMTTGDGGFLVCKNFEDVDKAKRIRWFGIDRSSKQKGNWENDIHEIGYKFHMNDISAAIGLASLEELGPVCANRRALGQQYNEELKQFGIFPLEYRKLEYDRSFSPWLVTIDCGDKRVEVMNELRKHKVESAQVHYRNDRYTVFRDNTAVGLYPNMDKIEDGYLVLPIHSKVTSANVSYICDIVGGLL